MALVEVCRLGVLLLLLVFQIYFQKFLKTKSSIFSILRLFLESGSKDKIYPKRGILVSFPAKMRTMISEVRMKLPPKTAIRAPTLLDWVVIIPPPPSLKGSRNVLNLGFLYKAQNSQTLLIRDHFKSCFQWF